MKLNQLIELINIYAHKTKVKAHTETNLSVLDNLDCASSRWTMKSFHWKLFNVMGVIMHMVWYIRSDAL